MNPRWKIFLFFILILFFSFSSHAAKKIEGYYIKASSGEKINVTFLIPFPFLSSQPNYELLQNGIRYMDGSEKRKLSSSEASEVSFVYKGVTALIKSVFNNLSNKQMFLHVIVDGKARLYHYYESNYSMGTFNPATGMSTGGGKRTVMRLVLQHGDTELFRVRRLLFKKDVSDFFSDCPTILERIHSMSVSDLPAIVMAYNKNCD